MFLFLISGPAVAQKSIPHIFGVGASYGYNFDGDMYQNSQSLYFLYKYNKLELNLGIKHYKSFDDSEYVPDLGLLYGIYDGDSLDFKVGIGVEDKYPTIEYVAEYAVNNDIGMTVALNQMLNDDFGQNQREIVVGFSYFFFDSVKENSRGDIEVRPYSLSTDSSGMCQTQVDKSECSVDTDVDKKPKEKLEPKELQKPKVSLPYVVKEGDSLYKLRRLYGFDLGEIIKNNDIKNPDLIIIGDVLK